jgi:superfamily II DNA or RNA helicase
MISVELTSYQWMRLHGPVAEINEAKELLKVLDSSAKFSRVFQRKHWDGIRKLYIDHGANELVTKSGMLEWLGRKLFAKGIEIEFVGKAPRMPREEDWNELPLELRDYQRESAEAVFSRQVGLLHLATNAGKTLIAAAVLKGYRYANCLYLVHRAELFRQSHKYFEEMLGQEIGKISAGTGMGMRSVTVGMIGTVYARMSTSQEMIDYLKDVDVVIVDEAHRAASKMYRKVIDATENAVVRIGMSGTFPPEESYNGLLLKGNFGETLYRVTNEDLKVLGVSAPMRAVIVKGSWYVDGLKDEGRKIFAEKYKKKGKKVFNPETAYWNLVYDKGILKNKCRTAFICNILRELADRTGVLVIVDRIEHGEEIFIDLIKSKSKRSLKQER